MSSHMDNPNQFLNPLSLLIATFGHLLPKHTPLICLPVSLTFESSSRETNLFLSAHYRHHHFSRTSWSVMNSLRIWTESWSAWSEQRSRLTRITLTRFFVVMQDMPLSSQCSKLTRNLQFSSHYTFITARQRKSQPEIFYLDVGVSLIFSRWDPCTSPTVIPPINLQGALLLTNNLLRRSYVPIIHSNFIYFSEITLEN